jgi:tetratricopeptide (TPR) repeat protein
VVLNDEVHFPKRDTYSIKILLNDIKKTRPTPGMLYIIGSEIIYYEWAQTENSLGPDNPVTIHLGELLEFLQSGYERRLIQGELKRKSDSANATINTFLKETPIEFQSYVLERSGDFIQGVLKAALAQRRREIMRYERILEGINKDLEKNPNDPNLWNIKRLALWVLGRYDEANKAAKKVKKLGWDPKQSKIVGV